MDAWSLLPPLIALALVMISREVVSSLAVALLSSEALRSISAGIYSPFAMFENTMNRLLETIQSPGNGRLILFSLGVGALIELVRVSGATRALVDRLTRAGFANSPRRTGLLTIGTSTSLFIESNLSILVSGLMSRGLFDRYGMSRARLAYFLHSFSPPICILILLNGWGAYILGLLGGYELGQSSVSILVGSIPLNFYALITIALVLFTVLSGRVFGPLRSVEQNPVATTDLDPDTPPSKARYMVLPLAVLLISMVSLMLITGNGDFMAGDGSRSVLYSALFATGTAYLLLRIDGVFTHGEATHHAFEGMKTMLPLIAILVVSIALGASLKELGTGTFVAGIIGEWLPRLLIIPMLFLAGALISFSTGTSWGTFAILIPIGVPLIQTLGLPPSLVLAAILGGGVFGDHCSPISDSTFVTAMASGCGVLEHVRTQLPYALTGAVLAFLAYLLAGSLML